MKMMRVASLAWKQKRVVMVDRRQLFSRRAGGCNSRAEINCCAELGSKACCATGFLSFAQIVAWDQIHLLQASAYENLRYKGPAPDDYSQFCFAIASGVNTGITVL